MKSQGFFETPQDIMEELMGVQSPVHSLPYRITFPIYINQSSFYFSMGIPRRSRQEAESVEGRLEFYHYLRLNFDPSNVDISEEEFTLLEKFVKDHIDVIREGEDKGLLLGFATYVIGSGDRIRLHDLIEKLYYGSGAGKSGQYFRKNNPISSADFSEEEYLSILRKDPFFLEELEKNQAGYDFLKTQITL